MPATRPDELPPIKVAAWLRIAGRLQGDNPKNLDGEKMDTIVGELHAGGKIHKNVSVIFNLIGEGLHASADIEDAIVALDFTDAFHLWLGQMLVMVDRANVSGPFFMIPWNYPGFLTVGRDDGRGRADRRSNGRDGGATVWGELADAKFKYFVGAFQTGGLSKSPLFSARLNLAVVGKEPGYFGNASYFGDTDVVAIGVGASTRKTAA